MRLPPTPAPLLCAERADSGCQRRAGSWHPAGLGGCSRLCLPARRWGAAVPSRGALELRPPMGAPGWKGEAEPRWGQGAGRDIPGGTGAMGSPPACLGLSRELSRCCFRGVKKQHMSPVPRRVVAGGDARGSPDAAGRQSGTPRCQRCPAGPAQDRGSVCPGSLGHAPSANPSVQPREDGSGQDRGPRMPL